MATAIVVGAGLRAIVAARMLVDHGFEVTVVDRAKRLGGVHVSIPWDGFQLDLGCHLFGNDDDFSTRLLLDLMGGEARPITPSTASIFCSERTEGIEYPDLTRAAAGDLGAALLGLIARAAARDGAEPPAPDRAASLMDYLVDRYGAAAAALVERACGKMLLAPAATLSADAFPALPARRLKLTDDRTAELLKRLPALDAVLLRSNADDPMRYVKARPSTFPARALYPKAGGMGGFAQAATERLRDLGVEFRLGAAVTGLTRSAARMQVRTADGAQVDGDLVIWAAGVQPLAAALGAETDRLAAAIHPIPMVLYYFDIPEAAAGPYHWVHDFDSRDRVFRASLPSRFGPDTAPPGRHYVCAEVPTTVDSEPFRDPEACAAEIWCEVVRTGVAAGPLPEHRKTVVTPASYRFPTTAFPAAVSALEQRLTDMPAVLLSDEFDFGKSASVRSVETLLAAAGY